MTVDDLAEKIMLSIIHGNGPLFVEEKEIVKVSYEIAEQFSKEKDKRNGETEDDLPF